MPKPKYIPKTTEIINIELKFAVFSKSGIREMITPIEIHELKKRSSFSRFLNANDAIKAEAAIAPEFAATIRSRFVLASPISLRLKAIRYQTKMFTTNKTFVTV